MTAVLRSSPIPDAAPAPSSAPTSRMRPTISDEILVERALDGDEWAEEAIYRRHVDAVMAMVVRLLGDRTEAEDVVQDTFVSALEELADLRDPAALGGWLRRVAVRKVHRRFRQRKLRRVLGLDRSVDELGLEGMAEDAPPDVRAELALLDRVLRRMPAPDRIAWTLRYVEGFSLAEVADLSDCSLATAKRRIAAAARRIARVTQIGEVSHA